MTPITLSLPAQKVADDVVLEIVRFVGNVVRDEACAQLFANAGLPNTLIELITAKQVCGTLEMGFTTASWC